MAKRDRGETAPERLAWLGRVISHPLRVQILTVLVERDASATDLAQELGEPLEKVSYHVQLLADAGALELRGESRRHGGRERTYGLTDELRAELRGLPGFSD